MKLVVVSHPCSNPQNQLFFQKLMEASGWDIVIIAPRRWRTEYGSDAATTKHQTFCGCLRTLRVFFSGNIPLHFYGLGLVLALWAERPGWIYIQNESYAISTSQVILLNRLFFGAKIAFYAAQNMNKTYPWIFRLIEQLNFRLADLAFPITESAAQCLRRKGFSKTLTVLPLGVDESCLSSDNGKSRRSDIPTVGYVGRLVPEKGVEDLLKALSQIGELCWQCRIAGDGPSRIELVELAGQLKISERVTFTGYIPHGEIRHHVKSLSVLVVPSRTMPHWREQFGRVIIEALAAGVPVIGTDSGEIPFLINKLEGGIVVKEGDIAGLACAIANLIGNEDERCRLGAKGRENVKRYFLESEIAKQFVSAIEG